MGFPYSCFLNVPTVVCRVWAGVWIPLSLAHTSSDFFFNSILKNLGTAQSRSTLGPDAHGKTLDLMSGPETVTVSLPGSVEGGECVLHEGGT